MNDRDVQFDMTVRACRAGGFHDGTPRGSHDAVRETTGVFQSLPPYNYRPCILYRYK